ncbi:MAG: hypothetical protein ACRELC_04045, partial [Gemmatimonadota bacterium]
PAADSTPAADAAPSPAAALGDSLVDAWIAAAGGLETWNDVRSARYTVTTVWYDSAGIIERMRPRRVELRKAPAGEQSRIERPESEGLYVQAFDGDTAWATLNGRPLPPDHEAAGEAEYVARDVFYWFGLPYKLRDPGVNRSGRPLPDGGFEAAVTFGDTVGAHPGDRYFYYFLDQDPFPEEVHYIEQDYEEKDRNRTVWSDFGQLGLFSYVRSRIWVDSAGNPTRALRIDDVQLNPTLPDSLFQPPRP